MPTAARPAKRSRTKGSGAQTGPSVTRKRTSRELPGDASALRAEHVEAPPTLVVVESPAKAKTLSKMLGKELQVRASKGHVADLPEHTLGVDVENGFSPTYVVKKEKKEVVEELKKAAQGKRVLIATDPDREGEAIGWHLTRLLGLDPKEPLRVEFHEITPAVVQKAVQTPRPIDQNLVDAQQARRVLDRLLGYNLSPLLSLAFRKRALSAGRVQSVALRLVVEREEEFESFRPEVYHLIHGVFLPGSLREATIPARLYEVEGRRLWLGEGEKEGRLHLKEAEVQALLPALKEAHYRVEGIETKERRKSPPPPFTTSTLQQLSSSRLGYTASRTMRIAQRLYEGVDLPEGTVGLITYMRTDSVRVSPLAVERAREVIQEVFGEAYLSKTPRAYANRKGQVQDAHEAIRPTDPARRPELVRPYLKEEEYRLYDLIWRRFIASQMAEALYETTTLLFASTDGRFVFRAAGSVQKFEGYLKAWGQDVRDAEPGGEALEEPFLGGPFPKDLVAGSPAQLAEVRVERKTTEPPPRYTDASLVKTLEELGIGRPSTYAPTLETLEKRAYIERQGRTLRPTPLGREVVHYLKRYFPKVVAYDFTAQMESRLDEVEEGRAVWPQVVQEFYAPFLEELAQVPKKTCPLCGRPLELKVSRYGQFLGCTGYPECTYTEPLERRESEPLEETCPKCGRPLVRKRGRYGTFIACSGYPDCDYTRDEAPSTGLRCPKCHKGEIVKKQSRRGKPYYRCSEKGCDFLSFYPLLEETCPLCGWNLVQKGKAKGCSNPDCPDYIGARGALDKSSPGRAKDAPLERR